MLTGRGKNWYLRLRGSYCNRNRLSRVASQNGLVWLRGAGAVRSTFRVSFSFVIGVLSSVRSKDHHGARGEVAGIGDAAYAGDHGDFAVGHLASAAFPEELANRLEQVGAAARKPGLSRRDLAAARVEGEVSGMREIRFPDVGATLAALAEAQHLQLQQDGNDEIVVRMERADVRELRSRLLERHLARDEVACLGDVEHRLGCTKIGRA